MQLFEIKEDINNGNGLINMEAILKIDEIFKFQLTKTNNNFLE